MRHKRATRRGMTQNSRTLTHALSGVRKQDSGVQRQSTTSRARQQRSISEFRNICPKDTAILWACELTEWLTDLNHICGPPYAAHIPNNIIWLPASQDKELHCSRPPCGSECETLPQLTINKTGATPCIEGNRNVAVSFSNAAAKKANTGRRKSFCNKAFCYLIMLKGYYMTVAFAGYNTRRLNSANVMC